MQFSETQMPARERSPNFYGVGGRAGGLQKSWTGKSEHTSLRRSDETLCLELRHHSLELLGLQVVNLNPTPKA